MTPRDGGQRSPDGARSQRSRFPVLALLITALGVALVLASFGVSGPAAEVVGGDVPVDAEAGNRLEVTAHNSPALVVNPTNASNLAVASRVDSQPLSCSVHVSLDGGGTWTRTQVPVPVPVPGPGPGTRPVSCFSPDLVFGPSGTLYLSFTSFADMAGRGRVPDGVWLASSRDGGQTLSAPVAVSGPLAFQVRLLADPVQPHRLFLTWLQASETGPWGFSNAGNPIMLARSNDDGATWESPVRVTPEQRARVVAPSLAAGPDGQLYLAYLDVADDRLDYHGAHEGKGGDPYPGPWALVLARSSDAGATWEEAVVDPGIVPTQRFLQLIPPVPSLAAGQGTGRVFVSFHDARQGDADVWLWRSEDAGRSWSRPTRINDTQPGDGHQQYLPALSTSPNGRLDVVYYDRRSDAQDVANEVSLQSSFDEGRTFGPRLRLSSRSFDSRIGVGRERGMPELGSRLGLASTNGGALAMWADTRAADPRTEKQDLSQAIVTISRPSPVSGLLRYAGVGLAGLGLFLVFRAIISRRRRDVSAPAGPQPDAG